MREKEETNGGEKEGEVLESLAKALNMATDILHSRGKEEKEEDEKGGGGGGGWMVGDIENGIWRKGVLQRLATFLINDAAKYAG